MPSIQFLSGHIGLPRDQLNLFKMTKLYRHWIVKHEDIVNDQGTVNYSEISNQIYFEFSDFRVDNYSEMIEADLIVLCGKFKPGAINLNLLLSSSDQDFSADNYYTNDLHELQVKHLIEAPTRTLFTPKSLEITS